MAAKAKTAPKKATVKAVVKKASAKPASKAIAPAAAPKADDACCTSSCCSSKSLCSLFSFCPIGKVMCTRSFWASAVIAFLVIFASDWFIHSRLLMHEYLATGAFWRTEGDMRHGLILLGQILTAMVYAVVVLGMGYAARWWGAMASGLIVAAPVALSAMALFATMPFANPTIPGTWAVTTLLQGALTGLAICAALKAARAPETRTGSCDCNGNCGCNG